MGVIAQLADEIYNGIALPLARVGRSEGFQGQAADASRAKLAEMSLRASQFADRLVQLDMFHGETVHDHGVYQETPELLKTSPLSALTSSGFGFLGEVFDETRIVDAHSLQGEVEFLVTDENERWGMDMLDNYFAAPTEDLKASRTDIYNSAGLDGSQALDSKSQGINTILSEGQMSARTPYQFSETARIALFDPSIPGKFQDKDLNFAGSSLADSLKLTKVGGKTLAEMNAGLGGKSAASGSTSASASQGAGVGGGGGFAVPGVGGVGSGAGVPLGAAGRAGQRVSADDIFNDLMSKAKKSEDGSSSYGSGSSSGSRGGTGSYTPSRYSGGSSYASGYSPAQYAGSTYTPSSYARSPYSSSPAGYSPGAYSYTPSNYSRAPYSYTPSNYERASYTPSSYERTPYSYTPSNYERASYTPGSYTRPSWDAGTHTSSAYTPSSYASMGGYTPSSYSSSGYGGGSSPYSTSSGLSSYGSGVGGGGFAGAPGSGAAGGLGASLKNASTAGTGGSAAGLGAKGLGASANPASSAAARGGMMPMMPMGGMAGAPGGGKSASGAGGKKSNIKNQDGDLYGADVKAVTPVISVQGASVEPTDPGEVQAEDTEKTQEKQSFEEFLELTRK